LSGCAHLPGVSRSDSQSLHTACPPY
jgi:hypothetical protein